MRHAWIVALMFAAAGCDGLGGTRPLDGKPPAVDQDTPQPGTTPASVQVHPAPGTAPATLSLLPKVSLEPSGAISVSDVSQVALHVDAMGASGEHTITVAFLTPSGATYQVMRQTFVGSAHDSVGVDFALPVAGTAIDSHDLDGVWTAQVLFDGEEHSRPTFELAP